MRGLAFAAGGLGFVLFLGGLVVATSAGPDPACEGKIICEKEHYASLLNWILVAWAIGVVLVGLGAGLLAHSFMAERKARPPPRPPVRRPVPVIRPKPPVK